MLGTPEGKAWLDRYALPLFLLLQAGLLFPRLGLLPAWGDEHFSLQTAAQPLPQVLETVGGDIHPPLYYVLLHFWIQIPWPATPLVEARAFSVLLALLTTVLIDRFWLKHLDVQNRVWFLLLWSFSPCMLLYARMARSYPLQLFGACLAVYAALGFLRSPRRWRVLFVYVSATACLLYVHYLPGIAILSSVTLLLLWRGLRRREPVALFYCLLANLLVGVAYLPWLRNFADALGRVARADPYSPVPLAVGGELLKLGYWFFSFSIGETPPGWVVVAAAALAPAMVWTLWTGVRRAPDWFAVVLPMALVSYLGASRWVSFAFIPARLLFVLPFYLLLLVRSREASKRLGAIVCGGLLCLSAGSIVSYFQQVNFLNKGYLVPYAEITELINEHSAGEDTAVIADTFNTDPWPVLANLREDFRVVAVSSGSSFEFLRDEIDGVNADTIWYFRNTHDLAPERLNERLESELARSRRVQTHLFVPYSSMDRLMMKLLGWRNHPSHFIQLLEMRR
jgi:hypothetical protein